MHATTENHLVEQLTAATAPPPPPRTIAVARARRPETSGQLLASWLRSQSISVTRHAAALRPFSQAEFGTDDAAPSTSHIQVVNDLIARLRAPLLELTSQVTSASQVAAAAPTPQRLARVVSLKDRAQSWVRAIEKIWDFYLELFGQRQSRYANWLLSCDRVALDCYQVAYMGCGKAKSIPAPPPFSYMRTGFSPATYRRGIPLTKLGRHLNPFPLVQLPYHRLVNPWTLGAVLHEVSHNLQADLGLNRVVPLAIGRRLLEAKMPRFVAQTWVNWNRETYADLCGLLLGGPAFVGSLLDILARTPKATVTFVPSAPHPTPWLRPFLSCELLRRMGFPEQGERYRRMWLRIYPSPRGGGIPRAILATLDQAVPLVVDAICYQPYAELGDERLAEVIRFQPKEQQMLEEAAGRLAAGTDPGVVPARFLIGATRIALGRRLARPGRIMENFYTELARR